SEISYEELMAAIREHGIEELRHVDLAMLEVDGNISVISDDFRKKTSHTIGAMGSRRRHKFKGRLRKS
ncbi:MAG TPA: YetF domain-containing protein, partial [Ferruginibacter sp.]|nr:YetF domain-containing protein [Ferruginibacter sp.]